MTSSASSARPATRLILPWSGFGRAEVRGLAAFGSASLLAAVSLGLLITDDGTDAHVYWSAWIVHLYGTTGPLTGYVYAPPFAEVIWPLTLLPWAAFHIIWASLAVAAYVWLLAPLRTLAAPLLIALLFAAAHGNIEWLVALVLVLGFARPGAWAIILLTKITPGVGLIWFAARREWHALAAAGAVTIAVAVGSLLLAPDLWAQWAGVLSDQARRTPEGFTSAPLPSVPLPIRLIAASGIVVWAAKTDRRWVLAPAIVLANPDLWLQTFGVLAAIPRLVMPDSRRPRGGRERMSSRLRPPRLSLARGSWCRW